MFIRLLAASLVLLVTTPVISAWAVSIPMDFESNEIGGGRIFLPCSYDGFSSRCLFDSGSNMNNVAFNQATKQLPVIGHQTFEGAAGIKKTCDIVTISNWSSGDFSQLNVPAVRCPDSVPSDTLGINYFSKDKFSFSIDRRNIETGASIPQGILAQPLKVYPKGHISISVELSGKPFEAIWDTGAGVSVVDQKLVAEMPQAFTLIQEISNGTDSTGNPVMVKLYKMNGLSIGGMSFPDSNILAMDFSAFADGFSPNMRIVLGPSNMQSHTWFINIPEHIWAVIPAK